MKTKALPIRRSQFDVGGFLAYVAQQGGEIGQPTNPYEVCRYRAYWRFTTQSSVHVVYAKDNGLLTFTGGSVGHYRAFLAGAPMVEHPGEPTIPFAPKQAADPASQSTKVRRKLLARDGDDCWFCGTDLGDDATIEHLIPKSKGGRNSIANYVLAHRKCNADAADLPLIAKIEMRARLRSPAASSDSPASEGITTEAIEARDGEGSAPHALPSGGVL